MCNNIRISRCRIYQGKQWHGRIANKHRYFYGLKVHLIVTESGHIVEAFFTPGACNDVLGMQQYSYDLPHGSVIYADKAFNDYAIEDALHTSSDRFQTTSEKEPKTTVSTLGSVPTTLLQKMS